MLNPSVDTCESIMLLENGHNSYKGKKVIRTFNTCSFDSVFATVSAIFADHENVQKQIAQLAATSDFLSMVTNMFSNDTRPTIKENALLRERNKILQSIFDSIEYKNGLIEINCTANVNYIIPKLLPREVYSYYRKKQCDRCSDLIESHRCFVDLNIEKFEQCSIRDLNSCLLDSLLLEVEEVTPCPCNGTRQIIATEFSNFIMIDLHLLHTIKLISLSDIPQELNILGIRFALKGCIEYVGDESVKRVGHYVSHIYRRNKQWELYDDKKTRILRSNIQSQIKGQVLFYVRLQ